MNTSSLIKNSSQTEAILAVDDNAENLSVLGELLSPLYQVFVSNSGKRALDLLDKLTTMPSLILLDIMMPEMDGYAVLAQLKKNPKTRDIPIIFLTALDSVGDEEHGLTLGAADYITKPIRPQIVLARVKTQLELKHARDILANQNEYLEKEVQRRVQDSELLQDLTIRVLTQLAATKDYETGAHIARTQRYVELLASALKNHPKFINDLAGENMKLIVRGAPLHDLGKVGVPEGILLKPGKLSPEEWAVMQTHAKRGADLLHKALEDVPQSFRFLEVASEIAHWHHEQWDGSGYPDALKGTQIPVSARLMAVADVFDALVTSRPYKKIFTPEEARSAIESQRGKHFDPDVVDAFCQCFQAFEETVRMFDEAAAHSSMA